jgi:pimeloyl-ACP methyl ester carboxylesterase
VATGRPRIEVQGALIHVTEAPSAGDDDGQPIVFLHAAASSGAQWRGVHRALGKRFRLLIPDLYADGQSAANLPSEGLRVLEVEDELIGAVLGEAGGRAHLVGHSYGGLLALRAALSHTEAVLSLLLIEPIAFDLLKAEGPATDLEEVERVRAECLMAVNHGQPERAAERFVDYWGGVGAFRQLSSPQQVSASTSMAKVVRCWGAIIDGHLAYGAITAPTTVLFGDRSPAPTRWIARRLTERVPHARLVELPGAGHHSPLSHPADVARALRQHIEWCKALAPPNAH